MFRVKSEPSDNFNVGKDSPPTRSIDDNRYISDIVNTDSSDNRSDKSLVEEMLLTVAYVRNERTSHALDYNTSNCERNEDIHGQLVFNINVFKTDKREACTDNTPGYVTENDHGKMHVEKELQYNNTKERDIHLVIDTSQHNNIEGEFHSTLHVKEESQDFHMKAYAINCLADISQHYRIGDDEYATCERGSQHNNTKEHNIHLVTDISQHDSVEGEFYSTMHVKEELQHNHIKDHDIPHATDTSQDIRIECKGHGTINAIEKLQPFLISEHDVNNVTDISQIYKVGKSDAMYMRYISPACATRAGYETEKRIHKRVHVGDYNCDVCVCIKTTSGGLKKYKLIHGGEKPDKCDICDYSSESSGYLSKYKLTHSGEKHFKCNSCDFKIKMSKDLKRHQLIHTG